MTHLGAEQTACYGMISIATDTDGAAIFYSHQKATGIWAVIGADGTDYIGHEWYPFCSDIGLATIADFKKHLQMKSFWCDNLQILQSEGFL
jgi:hypothetical protein